MSDELHECPFCGKSDKVIIYTESMMQHGEILWTRYGVKCKRCHFEMPTYTKKAVAIHKWNTRPAEDALKAEVEELSGYVKQFRETLAEVAKMANNSEQEQIFEKCRDALRDVYLEEIFRDKFDKILHAPDTEKGGR